MQKLRKALSVSLAVGVLATACSVFSAPAAADGGQVTTPYFHGLDENTDGLKMCIRDRYSYPQLPCRLLNDEQSPASSWPASACG